MAQNRDVLRLFFVNWALGALLGCGFAGALLLADIAGLRTLLAKSDMMLTGGLMLFGSFAVTFGGVVCGSAVMRMAREETPPRGPTPGNALVAAPIPVRISR